MSVKIDPNLSAHEQFLKDQEKLDYAIAFSVYVKDYCLNDCDLNDMRMASNDGIDYFKDAKEIVERFVKDYDIQEAGQEVIATVAGDYSEKFEEFFKAIYANGEDYALQRVLEIQDNIDNSGDLIKDKDTPKWILDLDEKLPKDDLHPNFIANTTRDIIHLTANVAYRSAAYGAVSDMENEIESFKNVLGDDVNLLNIDDNDISKAINYAKEHNLFKDDNIGKEIGEFISNDAVEWLYTRDKFIDSYGAATEWIENHAFKDLLEDKLKLRHFENLKKENSSEENSPKARKQK